MGMKQHWPRFVLVGVTLASVIVAVVLYGVMPEKMITHWGVFGQPDGWMSKFWGLAMFPLLNIFMLGMYLFVPRFEPKKENLALFRKEYDILIMWIVGFLNYIFALSLLYNLGVMFDMGRMVMPGLGLMFLGIGSILPKAKQNYMVGIRTPWTLSSEKVWKKTHSLGGKLFMLSGAVTILAVLLPSLWGFIVAIGSILLSSLVMMVYSWMEYKREQK